MPIDQGALGGYDMVISISQEAVNRQLEQLYLTEVDPPIPNGPKYLIDHEMHHRRDKLGNPAKAGLDGYICCPKMDFGGEQIADENDKFRVAHIRFKFRAAEDDELTPADIAAGKSKHSVFRYLVEIPDQYDDEGIPKRKLESRIIDGMEVSWQAVVAKKELKDVMEEIVKPSQDANSQVATTPAVTETLKNGKPLSSESKVPALNPQQAGDDDLDWKALFEAFVNSINTSFTNPQFAFSKNGEGIPKPRNPFVLGYTISQQNITMEEANPGAKKPPPPFFVPATFACTLSPKNDYSLGTMNYCMLTHRGKTPPYFTQQDHGRQLDLGADSPGRFRQNLFASFESKAIPGSADGILAYSQDIFLNHWIGSEIAPNFLIHPVDIQKQLTQILYKQKKHGEEYVYRGKDLGVKWNRGDKTNRFPGKGEPNDSRQISRGKRYERTVSTHSPRLYTKFNMKRMALEALEVRIESKVVVDYDQKKLDAPANDGNDKRRLKFQIGSYTQVTIYGKRRKASSILLNLGRDDSDCYELKLWLDYKNILTLGTSNINRGSFTVIEERAEHLNEAGDLKAYDETPPDSQSPGIWKHSDTFGWTNLFEWAFKQELDIVHALGKGVSEGGVTYLVNSMNKLIESLNTTVILPVGDVFMFKGLSVDKDGNVTTIVNYDVSTESKLTQHKAADWSFENWRHPEPIKKN